jgi:hypothetical protein
LIIFHNFIIHRDSHATSSENTHSHYFLGGIHLVFSGGQLRAIGERMEVHQQPDSPFHHQPALGRNHFLPLLFLFHPVF